MFCFIFSGKYVTNIDMVEQTSNFLQPKNILFSFK